MYKSLQVRSGCKLILYTGEKMPMTKQEDNTVLGNKDLDKS
jgi:hypothetical protein